MVIFHSKMLVHQRVWKKSLGNPFGNDLGSWVAFPHVTGYFSDSNGFCRFDPKKNPPLTIPHVAVRVSFSSPLCWLLPSIFMVIFNSYVTNYQRVSEVSEVFVLVGFVTVTFLCLTVFFGTIETGKPHRKNGKIEPVSGFDFPKKTKPYFSSCASKAIRCHDPWVP